MKTEIDAIMLFISELVGSYEAGLGTIEDKISCGQDNYVNNDLHNLDLTTEEGQAELHENIWLERLYSELNDYFDICESDKALRALSIDVGAYRKEADLWQWRTPIELDASASNLQIIGILLNDRRLMEMTNVIGETLQDPWKVKGVSRLLVKKCMTPKLYGSSATPQELWKKAKLKYTGKHVSVINEELKSGAFGLANQFKDFIINNCKPKANMNIHNWNDKFDIGCNKFRNVGDTMKAYEIWDSVDNTYNTILHTDTHKVADLEQFRLYMVTLLVHGIDGQIMDRLCTEVLKEHSFALPIHDA